MNATFQTSSWEINVNLVGQLLELFSNSMSMLLRHSGLFKVSQNGKSREAKSLTDQFTPMPLIGYIVPTSSRSSVSTTEASASCDPPN
jgi:hypothetical protein